MLAAIAAIIALAIWLTASGLAMGHDPTWKYWTDGDAYILYLLPGVLGLALGSPLVAGEIEQHTDRLAWSQSVTRTRWLATKILVGAALIIAVTALLTLFLEWWTEAVSLAASTNSGGFSGVRVQPGTFDLTGLVVVGYALFAYALGVALGTLIRRPAWAFAVGIPAFVFVRLAIEDWVRPTLVTPISLRSFPNIYNQTAANGWVFERTLSSGLRLIQLQPAGHYWALQGAEAGIFLAMALVLLAISVYAIRAWRSGCGRHRCFR
jgi:ABC-2 family transporter protein